MQTYELRRGWGKQIEGRSLRTLVEAVFGPALEADGKVVTSFGALAKLTTWTDGKSLFVETVMNPQVPEDVARTTISAYNQFLEKGTGYTTKERAKRAQAKAKGKT